MEHTQSTGADGNGRVEMIRNLVLTELATAKKPTEGLTFSLGSRRRDMADASQAAEQLDHKVINANRRVERIQRLENALQRLRNGWEGHCLDCPEEIPIERILKVPGVQRCVQCQTAFERINKRR